MTMYIGMDVHSKYTVCVIKDDTGEERGRTRVPTSEEGFEYLIEEYKVARDTRIGLETGCQARFVFQILLRLGMDPVVISANEVRSKQSRKGQKNDFRDALSICDGLISNQWKSIVWMPSQELDKLRRLLLRRNHFVHVCSREIASVKGQLRSLGIKTSTIKLTTESGWRALFNNPEAALLLDELKMAFAVWRQSTNNVSKLDKKIEKAGKPFEKQIALLDGVSGVGTVGSAAFVAWIGDPHRFANSNHLISYLGLGPSTYDSGDVIRHGHITKQGCPYLRSVLVELAHQSRRINHPLNPYYRKLCATKGKKIAVVAIAARLARIMWQMLRTGKPFDVNKLNVVAEPVTRIKRYGYRLKHETAARHN